MTDKEAMAMALEALECANSPNGDYENEITALKARLADPMREVQRLGQGMRHIATHTHHSAHG